MAMEKHVRNIVFDIGINVVTKKMVCKRYCELLDVSELSSADKKKLKDILDKIVEEIASDPTISLNFEVPANKDLIEKKEIKAETAKGHNEESLIKKKTKSGKDSNGDFVKMELKKCEKDKKPFDDNNEMKSVSGSLGCLDDEKENKKFNSSFHCNNSEEDVESRPSMVNKSKSGNNKELSSPLKLKGKSTKLKKKPHIKRLTTGEVMNSILDSDNTVGEFSDMSSPCVTPKKSLKVKAHVKDSPLVKRVKKKRVKRVLSDSESDTQEETCESYVSSKQNRNKNVLEEESVSDQMHLHLDSPDGITENRTGDCLSSPSSMSDSDSSGQNEDSEEEAKRKEYFKQCVIKLTDIKGQINSNGKKYIDEKNKKDINAVNKNGDKKKRKRSSSLSSIDSDQELSLKNKKKRKISAPKENDNLDILCHKKEKHVSRSVFSIDSDSEEELSLKVLKDRSSRSEEDSQMGSRNQKSIFLKEKHIQIDKKLSASKESDDSDQHSLAHTHRKGKPLHSIPSIDSDPSDEELPLKALKDRSSRNEEESKINSKKQELIGLKEKLVQIKRKCSASEESDNLAKQPFKGEKPNPRKQKPTHSSFLSESDSSDAELPLNILKSKKNKHRSLIDLKDGESISLNQNNVRIIGKVSGSREKIDSEDETSTTSLPENNKNVQRERKISSPLSSSDEELPLKHLRIKPSSKKEKKYSNEASKKEKSPQKLELDSKKLKLLWSMSRSIGLVLRNTIELKGCDTDQEKICRIEELMSKKGIKGKPTWKKIKKFNLQRELKALRGSDEESDVDLSPVKKPSRKRSCRADASPVKSPAPSVNHNDFSRIKDICCSDDSSD